MSKKDRRPTFEEFDARLRQAQSRRGGRARQGSEAEDLRTERGKGIGLALRIGTELVAGLAVGAGIGWLLDYWLGTRPWLMIVFFLLGSAAGMLNVYRTVSGIGQGVGYRNRDKSPGGTEPPDKDGG